jgi:hypothetical protein
MRPLLLVATLAASTIAEERLDDAEAEMAKGDQYAAKKDYVAALAHYSAARSLAPDKPGPYYKLGLLYALSGDCKQAMPNLEQYIKLKVADARPEATLALDGCKAKQAPAPAACPEGQVKSTDTAGHCCWPAQVWASDNRCVGQPQCPPGFTLGPRKSGCHKSAGCPPGKVISQVAGQCCWPGQGFSHEKNSCIGDPTCPDGMTRQGGDCVTAAPAERLTKSQIAETMGRARPIVDFCARKPHPPGQATTYLTIRSDGTVPQVKVSGPLVGSPLAACLERELRAVAFPAFKGEPLTVSWPFSFR